MSSILQVFNELVDADVVSVIERIDEAGRGERIRDVPEPYISSRVGKWLQGGATPSGSLWLHQSLALEKIAAGRSVVIRPGLHPGNLWSSRQQLFSSY
jgi:hypothetical protein